MRSMRTGICVALVFAVMGCAVPPPAPQPGKVTGNPKEPLWVSMPGSAEPECFTAVGSSMRDLNPSLTRKRAEDRARQELARTVEAECVSLIKDFMQAHRDYGDPLAAGSVEFTQFVSKTVAVSAINNSSVRNSWTNDMDGSYWVLMAFSRPDFLKSLQSTITRAAQAQPIVSKEVDPKLVSELQAHIVQKSPSAPQAEKR
ncbi:MAG: hypothetical protein FJ279_18660 [Planctomycetes bacterium]|nr:hypothetical protein [Planctomycetota bacterium]